MVKGGKVIYVRSQISSAGVAAVRCFRGYRLGRSETYVVLTSRRVGAARKRRAGAYAGSGGGLGGSALSTIRHWSHRGGDRAIAGSPGVHAQQVRVLASVPGAFADVRQHATSTVSVGS